MNSMEKTREFLRSIDLPAGDAYDLPTSEKRFADGGQYVRSTTATGGSTPAFETEEAWLADAAAYWGAAK